MHWLSSSYGCLPRAISLSRRRHEAFKTTFGVSAHHWVLDKRIEHAKVLMSHSMLPLPDVAYQTGFSSQSTLTRAFQRRVGESPGQWRRNAGPLSGPTMSLSSVPMQHGSRHTRTV
ncbi:helix-turn-helix transcriptional regulator [Granulicella sibirica]|uniref:helix-turn-helix transcriptional regulator n=1 Tax=Granulicella sibirica TaxID=2479048 RepID=UPI001008D899